jgi:hypothetical protein
MSILNNSDIDHFSHREGINYYKKDKGVKRSKGNNYAEQAFWKRARNVRRQKQSRDDNFVGETFPEDDYALREDPETDSSMPPVEIFCTDSIPNVVKVYHHDTTRIIPGTEHTGLNLTYSEINDDALKIGSSNSMNIMSAKHAVDNVLQFNKVPFQFDSDGAIWECRTTEHHFFLRLWINLGDDLVLEPIVCVGDHDTFLDYYYYDLFNAFFA